MIKVSDAQHMKRLIDEHDYSIEWNKHPTSGVSFNCMVYREFSEKGSTKDTATGKSFNYTLIFKSSDESGMVQTVHEDLTWEMLRAMVVKIAPPNAWRVY